MIPCLTCLVNVGPVRAHLTLATVSVILKRLNGTAVNVSMQIVPLVCALLAGCAWAGLGLSYKLSERLQCRTTPFTLVFSLVAGILTLSVSLVQATAWTNPRLWYSGLIMGVLLYGGIELATYAYALGSASITWTVVNLSVLVPVLLTHLVYREALYWIDPIILVIFVVMLAVLAKGMHGGDNAQPGQLAPFILTLSVLFFANGTLMFGARVKEELFGQANSGGFTAIAYLSCAGIALLIFLLRTGSVRISLGEWRAGACAGLCSSLGFLTFLAAVSFPRSSLFRYRKASPWWEGLAVLSCSTANVFPSGRGPAWESACWCSCSPGSARQLSTRCRCAIPLPRSCTGEAAIMAHKNKLNDLDGTEWIKFTRTWFCCDSHRYHQNRHTELHPARFPEEMVADFLRFFTKSAGWVLDPFAGSGATLVACAEEGRFGVGVELSARYAEVMRRRMCECSSGKR